MNPMIGLDNEKKFETEGIFDKGKDTGCQQFDSLALKHTIVEL